MKMSDATWKKAVVGFRSLRTCRQEIANTCASLPPSSKSYTHKKTLQHPKNTLCHFAMSPANTYTSAPASSLTTQHVIYTLLAFCRSLTCNENFPVLDGFPGRLQKSALFLACGRCGKIKSLPTAVASPYCRCPSCNPSVLHGGTREGNLQI